MTETIVDTKLLQLASRLAQRISPIDSDLEREVINIFDCLTDAYQMGFNDGYSDAMWTPSLHEA